MRRGLRRVGLLCCCVFSSLLNLGAWKTNGYWILSEGERIGAAALAGAGGALCGGTLAWAIDNDSRNTPVWGKKFWLGGAGVGALPAALYVYWKLGKLKMKARCEVASTQIARLLENEVIFPLEGKEKSEIDVSDDIEAHFVDEKYPLAVAKDYLDAMSKGMECAAGLADAVGEYLGFRVRCAALESKDLKELLEICAAGPGEEIEEEYLAALKVGAKRIRPVIKKILLVLTKDPRFEDQRRSADRERQHQEEMRIRRERNSIYQKSYAWNALFR